MKQKIGKSTGSPECAISLLKGGYSVHPVPAPDSTKDLVNSKNKAEIKNQNLMSLRQGNAIFRTSRGQTP